MSSEADLREAFPVARANWLAADGSRGGSGVSRSRRADGSQSVRDYLASRPAEAEHSAIELMIR